MTAPSRVLFSFYLLMCRFVRAARRFEDGHGILYADNTTDSRRDTRDGSIRTSLNPRG